MGTHRYKMVQKNPPYMKAHKDMQDCILLLTKMAIAQVMSRVETSFLIRRIPPVEINQLCRDKKDGQVQ